MPSRYSLIPDLQPPRVIKKAPTDIPHILKQGETLSQLAYRFYKDATLSWVIMYRNPDFFNEFEIPIGATIFIPTGINSVLKNLSLSNEKIL